MDTKVNLDKEEAKESYQEKVKRERLEMRSSCLEDM